MGFTPICHPSCRCRDKNHGPGAVFLTTIILVCCVKQGSSSPNNLMERVKTTWQPCVIRAETLLSHFKGCKLKYLVFHRKVLEQCLTLNMRKTRISQKRSFKLNKPHSSIKSSKQARITFYLVGTVH